MFLNGKLYRSISVGENWVKCDSEKHETDCFLYFNFHFKSFINYTLDATAIFQVSIKLNSLTFR